MKSMEGGTYYEFCSILDNYLEKCKIEKEAMDKIMNKNTSKHGRGHK
jgi:hypothetical protein